MSTANGCQMITEVSMCVNIEWDNTSFPNLRNQVSQTQANDELKNFYPLVQTRCSNALVHFLCSVYTPICLLKEGSSFVTLEPCRELCMYVRSTCEPALVQNDFSWPSHLECSNFPDSNNSVCLTIPNIESIQYPFIPDLPLPPITTTTINSMTMLIPQPTTIVTVPLTTSSTPISGSSSNLTINEVISTESRLLISNIASDELLEITSTLNRVDFLSIILLVTSQPVIEPTTTAIHSTTERESVLILLDESSYDFETLYKTIFDSATILTSVVENSVGLLSTTSQNSVLMLASSYVIFPSSVTQEGSEIIDLTPSLMLEVTIDTTVIIYSTSIAVLLLIVIVVIIIFTIVLVQSVHKLRETSDNDLGNHNNTSKENEMVSDSLEKNEVYNI